MSAKLLRKEKVKRGNIQKRANSKKSRVGASPGTSHIIMDKTECLGALGKPGLEMKRVRCELGWFGAWTRLEHPPGALGSPGRLTLNQDRLLEVQL